MTGRIAIPDPAPMKRAALCLIGLILAYHFCCRPIPHPPRHPDNLCSVFQEHPGWWESALASADKWSVPIPVMMAIMYHESRFRADARPPRETRLFLLPGPRPSTAFGYPQALDGTWDQYVKRTGNHGARRDDFADSVDFIGWYCHLSGVCRGIPPDDPFRLYLAYHEGHAGFRRRSYADKPWLLKVARRVADRARRYEAQLTVCGPDTGIDD